MCHQNWRDRTAAAATVKQADEKKAGNVQTRDTEFRIQCVCSRYILFSIVLKLYQLKLTHYLYCCLCVRLRVCVCVCEPIDL